jgi:hypothetical protein
MKCILKGKPVEQTIHGFISWWHLTLILPSSFTSCVCQLKKRLFWLLKPLVVSLGDSGDNLSFLLRMSELIGKNFRPVLASEEYNSADTSKRLVVVCHAAQDVLLKFVKKDVDLSSYSGPVSDLCPIVIKRRHIWLFLHFPFLCWTHIDSNTRHFV